jgi:uncharacterized protein
MKFIREPRSPVTVRHVEEGLLKIGEETVSENVMLFRGSIQYGWSLDDGGDLTEVHLAEIIAAEPEIIIFGTGWQSRLPPRDLVFTLARKGIGFETMNTPAACRTFNILLGEDRDVAAVLLIK